ncbi:MAG: hypothetical protein JST44_24740 [Cyanobacteria bacterium SZAS LIN-5]|nr:hypothetical protein [Cyanobacteria bacterium SZAS LIN-5]
MLKKRTVLLVIWSIVGNCLGTLSSDIVRSGYNSIARNIRQVHLARRAGLTKTIDRCSSGPADRT